MTRLGLGYVLDEAQDVLNAIEAYTSSHGGVPPTVRELAALCHLSSTAMHYRLGLLEAHGYIKRKPGKIRTICVVPPEERKR